MRNIVIPIVILTVLLFSGCEDFLDTRNLYEKDLSNFYKTPSDITEAIGGVYNALYVGDVMGDEQIIANLLSDLMLGGGGPDDVASKNVDAFLDPTEDTYRDLWRKTYDGVYRANAIIEAVTDADYTSFFRTEAEATNFKNTALGEAYFMRGFFMLRAARFFGGMPLIMTTDTPRDVPRSSFDETFGVITADFLTAASLLPEVDPSQIPLAEYGHTNRWVAKAYIARAYLFYTGYMTNIEKKAATEVPLPDGSLLSKTAVTGHLEDIINLNKYELTPDFRNLWPYSYVNTSAGETVLPWADDENLKWVGQDGFNSTLGTGNKEVMFSLRYAFGDWGWSEGTKYNNRTPLFFGIRSNSLVPFGEGWGWGTIHTAFYNSWPNDDMRKEASVLVVGDAEQGTEDYEDNKGDHETGLFNKKYTSLQHNGKDGVCGMFYYIYSWSNADMQLWGAQDFYYLRYADVLLMHSELTETSAGLNAVRMRAGYEDPINYSIDNLKRERMYEFAFEGLRWYDLVRWGDVEKADGNFFSTPCEVMNSGVPGIYTANYRIETKGLLSIPEGEIRLSNGVYEQNPGW